MAAGDLNGDGIADVVTANLYSQSISILLGRSDGSFGPSLEVDTGSSPGAVALADLNGDGKLDLAITGYYENTVSVRLGNGDGTVGPGVDYDTGGNPHDVAIADFNRDGIPDLAVANLFPHTTSILLGHGDGTFSPRQDYGDGSYSVTVADVNHDGKLDLVSADFGAADVMVMLGRGDGSFEHSVAYPSPQTPTSVAIGDLNGDGNPDLVVTSFGGRVSTYLGIGDGTFAPRTDYPIEIAAFSAVVRDLDGDGKPDVTLANTFLNTVSVFMGNGDGTLGPRADYGSVGCQAMTVMDVNGDHRPDLVVANYYPPNISVLLQKAPDVTPPTLSVALSPAVLWPPNHDLRSVHATVTAHDDSGEPPAISLVSITSSEPDRGAGAGDVAGDIQDASLGTADLDFRLRAERLGGDSGRRYTVCYEARDRSGNVTRQCGTVEVPHSNKGHVDDPSTDPPPAPDVMEAQVESPAQGRAWIRYGLPHAGHVRLEIFDVTGRLVAVPIDGMQPAGWGQVSFAATRGSGIYLYRLESDDRRLSGKFALLR